MLGVVVAAAFLPNAGAVPATSNCTYGQCPSSSGLSPLELASIGAIVVVGLLVGILVLMRRRRPPATPLSPYSAGSAPPPAAVMPAAPPPPSGPAAESYVEGPDDVSTPPPVLVAPGAAPAAAAGPAPAADSEPDIDSLMAELDKISGEILKRTPKKAADADDADDDPAS